MSCDALCQKYNVTILKRGSLKGQFTHKTLKSFRDNSVCTVRGQMTLLLLTYYF